MKKSWIFILVITFTCIAVVLVVSLQFLPVEKLLRPPKQEGENSVIQEVFEQNISGGYTLKVAESGEYDTAYNFADIDGDSQQEVIVTYCEPEDGDIIKFCILNKDDNEWEFLTEINTEYNVLEFVDFLDTDNDSIKELVLGMSIKGALVTKRLNIYDINTDKGVPSADLCYECDYTGISISDINSDGALEIVKTDISQNRHKLSVLNYRNGKFSTLSSVYINKNLKTLTALNTDRVTDGRYNRIHLDGYIIDGTLSTFCYLFDSNNNKLTEINGGGSFDGLSISRKIYVNSTDINDDGLIELPLQTQLNDSEIISSDFSDSSVDIILWSNVYKNKSEEVLYHIINNKHKYTVVFDPDWYVRFTFVMDVDKGELTFYTLDENQKRSEPILSILTTSEELAQYTKINENSKRNYYLIMHDYALSKGFTIDKVKKYILF